jgi:hypothetical protein
MTDFESALLDGASKAQACYGLALAHLGLGDRDHALLELRRALADDPQHRESQDLFARLSVTAMNAAPE